MPQSRFSAFRCSWLVLLTAACTDAPSAPRPAVAPHIASNSTIPLVPLADGAERAVHPCRTGPSRQFDFWLGDWDVTAFGTPAGTNRVVSEVDGCVVAEYWMGAGGVPGWSLNMYDSETNSWHQHWVAAGGLNLFLTGSLQGKSIVIAGPRQQPNGATVIDRIAYTPLPGGEVRQFWDISSDGGETFPVVTFDGLYAPTPVVRPAAEVPLASCATAPYHAADFLLGEWMIRTPDGDYVGKTEFTSELSNCLVLQVSTGRAGYESKAFLTYGRLTGVWRMTHVGSDGERLFLEGVPGSGTLTLGGTEKDGGVDYLVRVTYTAGGTGRLTQRWERSADAGARWQELAVFDLARH